MRHVCLVLSPGTSNQVDIQSTKEKIRIYDGVANLRLFIETLTYPLRTALDTRLPPLEEKIQHGPEEPDVVMLQR